MVVSCVNHEGYDDVLYGEGGGEGYVDSKV